MALTVGDVVRDALTQIGQLNEGVATGGSTSTVVDSGLGGSDDDWNGGTVMITRDAGGAGAAPEGEFAIVTDYTASTGTITCASNSFTQAPAAGDIYGVATSYFPLRQVIRALNLALQSLGDIPQVDTTTLDTATAQTEYTYAVAWKRNPPIRVDIQTKTGDADDNRWVEISKGAWQYVPATAGSTGLLVFQGQLPTSRDLRIWYEDKHAVVNNHDDVIYEGFHPELVLWETIYQLLMWQNGRLSGSDEAIIQQLNNASQKRNEMRNLHKVWRPKRKQGLLILTKYVDRNEFVTPS